MTNQTEEFIASQFQPEEVHAEHHYDVFYENPAFWVGLSFIIVVVALAKPISKIVSGMMKNKIQSIKDQIEEVKQLEIDAKNLLKEYESKLSKIEEETAKILAKSNQEIDYIKKSNIEKLDKEMERKKADVEQTIKASGEQATKEINSYITEKTIKAVKEAILSHLSSKSQDELIEKSIERIEVLKK